MKKIFSNHYLLLIPFIFLTFYSFLEILSFLILSKHTGQSDTLKPDYAGGVSFKENIIAKFPGYAGSLGTDNNGYIHNGNSYRSIQKDSIFIFGGSTIAGIGSLSNKETIPAQLEKCLREKKVDKQVINVGFPGDYSLQQKHRLFNRVLVKNNPSHIIFFDGRNDAHYTTFQNYLPFNANFGIWGSLQKGSFDNTKPKLFYNTSNLAKNSIKLASKVYRNRILLENEISSKINDNIDKGIHIYNDVGKDVAIQLNHLNIKFIRILQPTLFVGNKKITESESEFINEYFKRSRLLNNQKKYVESINKFYNKASKIKESYFINFSDLFDNINSQLYVDTVHYNYLGNRIISKNICKLIEE